MIPLLMIHLSINDHKKIGFCNVDVLEHVDEPKLDSTFDDICDLTSKALLLIIDLQPAVKTSRWSNALVMLALIHGGLLN